MVVVICCRHGAPALAGSRFLCKHTWERVLLKQKKMMLSWIFQPMAPCSIRAGGSFVCGVFGHRDLTWYFIMLVKAQKKGSLENSRCTVPWGRGKCERASTQRDWARTERTDTCLSSVRNCEKPLSVTAIKSCLGLTESLAQRNLLLYWLLNNTWLLILIACCIYFYEVLLKKKKTDFLGSDREREREGEEIF